MSIYQTQKSTKPKPEAVARDFLDSKKVSAFLRLVEYLRANKIGIPWVSGNSWGLNVKGKRIGFIKIAGGSWLFCQQPRHMKYYENMKDSDLHKFVFNNIYPKTCLEGKCGEGPDMPITDYNKSSVCGCWPLRIFNPDEEALEYTKRLIILSKVGEASC